MCFINLFSLVSVRLLSFESFLSESWMWRWGFPGSRSLASVKEVKTIGLGVRSHTFIQLPRWPIPLALIIVMTDAQHPRPSLASCPSSGNILSLRTVYLQLPLLASLHLTIRVIHSEKAHIRPPVSCLKLRRVFSAFGIKNQITPMT